MADKAFFIWQYLGMLYGIPFNLLLKDFFLSFSIMMPMIVYLLYLGSFKLPINPSRHIFSLNFARWTLITILLILVIAISTTTAGEAGIAMIMTSGYAAISWVLGFIVGFIFSFIFKLPEKTQQPPPNSRNISILITIALLLMSVFMLYN